MSYRNIETMKIIRRFIEDYRNFFIATEEYILEATWLIQTYFFPTAVVSIIYGCDLCDCCSFLSICLTDASSSEISNDELILSEVGENLRSHHRDWNVRSSRTAVRMLIHYIFMLPRSSPRNSIYTITNVQFLPIRCKYLK